MTRTILPPKFSQRLDRILVTRNSLVCVGLDPDPSLMPKSLRRLPPRVQLARFLDGIVDATFDHAAAYKMQLGSYLQYGAAGVDQLVRLTKQIGSSRVRILDIKTNDIPNTIRMVRDGVFGEFGFDAVTFTPWLGWETLGPFLDDPAHGVFVVAHSSNPGAIDFQEIPTPRGPLWLAVVGEVRRLAHAHGNVGVVLGATFSDAFHAARATLGNGIPMLVPGVGAQGGSLATAVREGVDAHGRALLVNASRSILYASAGTDWRKAAGAEAERLKVQINQLRAGLRTG
ncbi:MAG TPA: orotidine-5'-phosphate decarboxylase [Thermoplasmata archaeon]|nr:orotidine-5'-phosphate decarboxylase [Thermoplasmata archaeon]HYB77968.1 orotidine-5'-phosphate decarboxylase [Thermoplasmata archaeon]